MKICERKLHYLFSFDQILLSGITNHVSKVQTKKKKTVLTSLFLPYFLKRLSLSLMNLDGWQHHTLSYFRINHFSGGITWEGGWGSRVFRPSKTASSACSQICQIYPLLLSLCPRLCHSRNTGTGLQHRAGHCMQENEANPQSCVRTRRACLDPLRSIHRPEN